MKEKQFIIENQNSFELRDIFECGQCFRWNKLDDESYTGVIKDAVINVKKENNKIIFRGNCKKSNDFEKIILDYFDLNTDYNKLKKQLSDIDENLKLATRFGSRN